MSLVDGMYTYIKINAHTHNHDESKHHDDNDNDNDDDALETSTGSTFAQPGFDLQEEGFAASKVSQEEVKGSGATAAAAATAATIVITSRTRLFGCH
jgi:hypothetical protein